MFNEDQTSYNDIFYLTKKQCIKLGVSIHEFNARKNNKND